jgi:hypothetical protein
MRYLATFFLALALGGGVAGCAQQSDDPETNDATTPASAPEESGPPADAVPEELQATWLLDVDRDQIGTNLKEAGYGKLVDDFYKSEGLETKRTVMTLTFYPDYFEIAWLLPDQSWDVGWTGTARAENEVIHFDDDYFEGVTDSFAWSVAGDELTLDYQKSTVAKVHGLPSETYAAYFGQPWTRADCEPQDLDACL